MCLYASYRSITLPISQGFFQNTFSASGIFISQYIALLTINGISKFFILNHTSVWLCTISKKFFIISSSSSHSIVFVSILPSASIFHTAIVIILFSSGIKFILSGYLSRRVCISSLSRSQNELTISMSKKRSAIIEGVK